MAVSPANLRRLLNPRHIAFIGGDDAAFSAEQCARHFDGPVWGVNPKRDRLGGVPCFRTVDELPEAPDAVFLATPRAVTIDTVQALNAYGAGGIACFTAGFGELGGVGLAAERALIAAAGEMALVGPNCYGLINYCDGATLWPFGAGDTGCQRGIALVMQSGMLPANLTMNDRSVPISYVISAGNQAVLAIEDYIDALIDDDRVTGFGLYIEGIKSIDKFAAAALRALHAGKPIAVLKAGSSKIASRLAMSHTGSIAGTDQAFDALFAQLGVIRVASPVEMIETLKFLSISGAPSGRRIAAFTCSGGDAAMLADICERVGLELPQPSANAAARLTELLPDIATVSNPLDYTTPIWGNREVMPGVFQRLIEDGYDAAVVIQDFPPEHIHADNTLYRNDASSFAQAVNACKLPGAVCSDLPENIDRAVREEIIANGVTPLQGIDAGMQALANACDYGVARAQILAHNPQLAFRRIGNSGNAEAGVLVDEWQGKQRLQAAGLKIPNGRLVSTETVDAAAAELGFPLVLKAVSEQLAHKSEAGAVIVNLHSIEQVKQAMADIQSSLALFQPGLHVEQFLLESMVEGVIAELMIGVNADPQFGQLLVIASGGVLVELMQDAQTLLLPTSDRQIRCALHALKGFRLLDGFRGKPIANLDAIVACIQSLIGFAEAQANNLLEIDINPLMVCREECVAVDVMIREATD